VDEELTRRGEVDFLPTVRSVLAAEPDGLHRSREITHVERRAPLTDPPPHTSTGLGTAPTARARPPDPPPEGADVMYTHRWAYQPAHPAYHAAWPAILDDTGRILDHVAATGIIVAGPHGCGAPVIDASEGIAFNGDATCGLHGDPFTLLPPMPRHPRGIPTATAFCATGRRPYDVAVAAVLLRLALLVPDAFAVSSDGAWDLEWAHGAQLPLAPTGRGARALIVDLFDLDPPDSPLRDTLTGVRFTPPTAPTAPTGPTGGRLAARSFQVDQAVHVHAYGNWRPGTVTKIGRSRVTVRYARNAAGTPDERAFPTDQIQPAHGVALVAVSRLRRGDLVVQAGGDDLVVEKVRPGPRRYRTVTYTDGSQVDISTQTVMRVRT
jgi:hypothetical protein